MKNVATILPMLGSRFDEGLVTLDGRRGPNSSAGPNGAGRPSG
jgi:hypothetical protein